MRKILLIGWKDLTLAFRDRAALVLMLAAPFLLTLGLGFVTGRLSGSGSTGVSDIPIVMVNQDGGQLGEALVELFQSDSLSGLVRTEMADDPAWARQHVDDDEAAAAIIIPPGFSDSIIPPPGATATGAVVQIVLYTNPSRPTSVGVVKTILEEFLSQVEIGRVSGQVAVTQLIQNGLISVAEAPRVGSEIGARQAATGGSTTLALRSVTDRGEAVEFDVLAYMAPGMALMFLMFTASNGGRSLLTERNQGTLPRLLVSPTTSAQVLAGKVVGVYLTGVAQMLILIGASMVLFQLSWGNPLAVVVLVLAAVAGAVGWGMLITALAKTPGQVSTIGSAITLTFGLMGGSFINTDYMPESFRLISKITPNAWGLDGFSTLAMGGKLADIGVPVLALVAMGAALFAVAAVILARRGLAQQ